MVNRSPDPARRAAELAGPAGRVGEAADVAAADLVVNATSLGMAGATGSRGHARRSRPSSGRARSSSTSCTTPPRPRSSPPARARGAVAVNGVGMLVHQAAHAFTRWTGRPLRSAR